MIQQHVVVPSTSQSHKKRNLHIFQYLPNPYFLRLTSVALTLCQRYFNAALAVAFFFYYGTNNKSVAF